MISVLSCKVLKITAVTIVTMIIPWVWLQALADYPSDLSGQKFFYKPDRNHLHHRHLFRLTHRGTVLMISMEFQWSFRWSLCANISTRIGASWGGLLFGVESCCQGDWVLGPSHSPLLNVLRYIRNSSTGRKFVKKKLNRISSNQRKAI